MFAYFHAQKTSTLSVEERTEFFTRAKQVRDAALQQAAQKQLSKKVICKEASDWVYKVLRITYPDDAKFGELITSEMGRVEACFKHQYPHTTCHA